MKVHSHPFWLCLCATALITTVATPARADVPPVNPSIIKVKAEFAKWTIALEDKTSGKVKIWAEDPYNSLVKKFSDENPIWDSKADDTPFIFKNQKEYWIAFYPNLTSVDLTVSFTRKLPLTSTKVVKLKVVQKVWPWPKGPSKATLTPTSPSGSGAKIDIANFGLGKTGDKPTITLD